MKKLLISKVNIYLKHYLIHNLWVSHFYQSKDVKLNYIMWDGKCFDKEKFSYTKLESTTVRFWNHCNSVMNVDLMFPYN